MKRWRKVVLSERGIYEPKISEEDVFKACRQLLELNGARLFRIVERIPWGKTTSEPGLPDSFGWFPPKLINAVDNFKSSPVHFYIEFKRPGGRLRPAQVEWLDRAREDGVIAFMADSVNCMVREFKKFGISIKGL